MLPAAHLMPRIVEPISRHLAAALLARENPGQSYGIDFGL